MVQRYVVIGSRVMLAVLVGVLSSLSIWSCGMRPSLGQVAQSPDPVRASISTPVYWPTLGWRTSTPEEQGIDSTKLIKMLERVRDKKYAIDSITIVRNGYLVIDAYLYPFQKNTKHVIESVTKSFTSALVGIALDKGYIKQVNQPILEFFPDNTIANLDEKKRRITLEHVLTMTTGLDTQDTDVYDLVGFVKMISSENWVQYVLDRPMAQAPGRGFDYSNGGSHLLSAIIRQTTNMSTLEFAQKHLFGPLGITDVNWSTDPQGLHIGEGQMMLTPHDMAKFGLLYLNRGRWDNRQIISEEWVEASVRKHISTGLYDGYGYQWWIDSTQYHMAMGINGQFIFVIPQKNMVVVFTSHFNSKEGFDIPKRLLDRYIISATMSPQPLVSEPNKKEQLDLLLTNLTKAPAQGFVWTAAKNGMARDGTFIRTTSPAFQFRYPATSLQQKLLFPGMVMAMQTRVEGHFSASIREIPANITLAEVGPKVFTCILEDFGSNIEVVSNQRITLEDGTAAYRTDINWKFQSRWRFRNLLVSVFKDRKWVFLTYATPIDYYEDSISENLNEGMSIVESLTFQ